MNWRIYYITSNQNTAVKSECARDGFPIARARETDKQTNKTNCVSTYLKNYLTNQQSANRNNMTIVMRHIKKKQQLINVK